MHNKNYLYYVLFIFFYTFFQATLNGYTFQYLWPNWIWWANICLPIFISAGTLWCLVFNKYYLNTGVVTPIFDKIVLGLMGLCVVNGAASFFLIYSISIRIATALNIVSFIIIFINSYVSLFKGYRTARIYALAWTAFLLGTIIFALKSFGLVPNNLFTNWSGMLGSVIVVILLSLALTEQINVMRQEKTEALTQLNEAYSRFVPLEFLKLLEKDSILDIKLGDQVQREITILFSDIRSFTTLSEGMTPEENFNFLNSYLSRISPIIRKYNGFIDKYVGDAIMALFPGNSLDALNASIEIRKELWEFNRIRYAEKLAPIEIGIGLHCGTVMLGTIGEERRIDGTVIADTVNLASRLEGITKIFGSTIIISKDIYEKLQEPNSYRCRYLGKIKLKGKNIGTEIYEVIEGFTEQIAQIKMSTMQDFQEGLNLYHHQKFTESLKAFKKIILIDPKDKAAQYYYKIITNRIKSLVYKSI
jgi:adenylate cyclase